MHIQIYKQKRKKPKSKKKCAPARFCGRVRVGALAIVGNSRRRARPLCSSKFKSRSWPVNSSERRFEVILCGGSRLADEPFRSIRLVPELGVGYIGWSLVIIAASDVWLIQPNNRKQCRARVIWGQCGRFGWPTWPSDEQSHTVATQRCCNLLFILFSASSEMVKEKPNSIRIYDSEGYRRRAACICVKSDLEDEVSCRKPKQTFHVLCKQTVFVCKQTSLPPPRLPFKGRNKDCKQIQNHHFGAAHCDWLSMLFLYWSVFQWWLMVIYCQVRM